MSNVISVDGVAKYVDCGNGATLQLTAAITMEVLVKITSRIPSYCNFIHKWNGVNGYIMSTDALTGQIKIFIYPGGAYTATSTKLKLNTWHRIGATWSAVDNLIRVYLDGNLIGTSGAITPLTDSGTTFKFTFVNGGFSFMPGYVAQVNIYNRALSDDEMLYNNSHPNNPKRRGLVLNLTQDSIYGTQWQDLSGNANHGTYLGGAVPVTANILAGR